MPVLMFLMKYWKYIASILLILAVFGYWKSLTSTITRQENQIVQLKVDLQLSQNSLGVCTDANNEFKRLTDMQNAEIAKQAELAKQQAIKSADLLEKNKKLAKAYKDASAALADAQLNSKPCVEAVDQCYEILGSLP
mgnify:CR=1 FL=1